MKRYAQQDFFSVNVGDDAWDSEGPDEDRVEFTIELGESVWRDGNAIGGYRSAPQSELGECGGTSCFKNSDGLRDDFTPDSVTRQNGDTLFGVHER